MSDLFLDNSSDLKLADTEVQSFDSFLSLKLKAKEILPQINWVFTQRKVEYLSVVLELRKHSSIQVRRKVAQGVSFLADKENLEDLQKWQLSESDRDTWLILESTLDKIQRKNKDNTFEKNVKILTVTEGLNIIKRLIGEQEYIIEGEVSEVRIIKQMYSVSLKDNQESRMDCWVYGGVVIRAGFPLNEGLAVRLTGKFKLSAKTSKIYFDVTKIQLSGEGELLRNLKLLEEKLRKEGLFDNSRKRPLSKLPKNILLLASSVSAAITDFTKVLSQRRGGVQIYHLPIKTQGVGAEAEILENLESVNELTEKYSIDTVVLTRGGGSQSDLVVFNSEKVVRALHGINRPTIVAIGHERDFTLAEFVADLRASTPSQAAELVSLSTNEVVQQLTLINSGLFSYLQNRSREYNQTATNFINLMIFVIQKRIKEYFLYTQKTGNTITSIIGKTKMETQRLWQNSFTLVKINLNRFVFSLESLKNLEPLLLQNIYTQKQVTFELHNLIHKNIVDRLSTIKNQFELNSSILELHDPENILKKGYAIVTQNHKIIEKVELLGKSKITIKFQDGEVDR